MIFIVEIFLIRKRRNIPEDFQLRSGEDMPGSGVALTALQGSDVQYVPRGMLQISANGWHALLQDTIQEVQIGICGMFFWHSNSSCSIFLYVNYNI